MMDIEKYINTALLILVTAFFTSLVSCGMGLREGRREVASGKFECHLQTTRDKTTEWVCAEVDGIGGGE